MLIPARERWMARFLPVAWFLCSRTTSQMMNMEQGIESDEVILGTIASAFN
jgi:hypothetical protein